MNELEDNEKNIRTASKMNDSDYLIFVVGPQGDRETFCIDRVKIITCSSVFHNILAGYTVKNAFDLSHITRRAFGNFLMFIDKGNLKLSRIEESVETWIFAHEFQLNVLKNICEQFISLNVSVSNACYVFHYAVQIKSLPIIEKCEELFSSKTKDVIESKAFTEADISTVKAILKSEKLTLQLEVDLFGAVLLWAKQEGIKKWGKSTKDVVKVIIRPLLPYIRFLDMSVTDFINIVVNSQVLTKSEERALLINIISQSENIVEIPEGLSNVRCSRISEMLYLKMYRRDNTNCDKLSINTEFQTTIKVNTGAIQVCRLYFPFMEKEFKTLYGTVLVTLTVYDRNDSIKLMKAQKGNLILEDEENCYVHCHSGTIREGDSICMKANPIICTPTAPVFKCTYYGYETVGSAYIAVVEEKEKTSYNFKKISIFCKSAVYI